MPRGGKRPGSGKKKGSINKRTLAAQTLAKASGLLPHEFLLQVSQGKVIDGHKPTFDERIDCAYKAAPFFAGRISNVVLHGPNDDGSHTWNVNLIGADARA